MNGNGSRSRRFWPAGLLGMLALVACIELAIGHPDRFVGLTDQWYWRLAKRDAEHMQGRDFLAMGDSLVKLGVAPGVIQQSTGRRGYNLAIGGGQAPATYYMLRRALAHGAKPSAILVDFFPRLLQLDANHNAENWSQLLTAGECLELAWNAGRSDWAGQFLVQQLLPSVAHRNGIRTNIKMALFDLSEPKHATRELRRTFRLHAGVQGLAPGAGDFNTSVNGWVERFFSRLEFSPVNALYAKKTLDLAAAHGLTVYWLVPPMMGELEAELKRTGFDDDYTKFLRRQVERSPNVVVVDARGAGYDPAIFYDRHHLSVRGTGAYSLALAEVLKQPVSDAPASRWVTLPPYRPAPEGLSLMDPDARVSRLAGAGRESEQR